MKKRRALWLVYLLFIALIGSFLSNFYVWSPTKNKYKGKPVLFWRGIAKGLTFTIKKCHWIPEPAPSHPQTKMERILQYIPFAGPKEEIDESSLLGGDVAALPVLLELLEDQDPDVRWAAVLAIGKIGPPARQAIPALCLLIKNEKNTRLDDPEGAGQALGLIGVSSVNPLIELLEKENLPNLTSVWMAFSIIGPEAYPGIPFLIKEKMEPYPRGGDLAWQALKNIGPAALPEIKKALKDQDRRVRARAAFALGGMGPAALPEIKKALKDQD